MIQSVEQGSPAARAGIVAGDQVATINNHSPRNFIEFASRLLNLGQNRRVKIQISRKGEIEDCTVKLIPESAYFNTGLIRDKTGVTLEELTPDVAKALSYNSTNGLVVSQVDGKSPADKAGLVTGVVVVAIDEQEVSDIVSAARLLHGKESGDRLMLDIVQVRRSGLFLRRATGRVSLGLR